ncbi:MAG: hypothetical protein JWR58_4763 [Pseudonocardia sp.]|nr:hypothetical protein [Pseudonocardia sp.]
MPWRSLRNSKARRGWYCDRRGACSDIPGRRAAIRSHDVGHDRRVTILDAVRNNAEWCEVMCLWGVRTPHKRETWVLGVVRRGGDDQLWCSVCSIWSSFDWPAGSSTAAGTLIHRRRTCPPAAATAATRLAERRSAANDEGLPAIQPTGPRSRRCRSSSPSAGSAGTRRRAAAMTGVTSKQVPPSSD